jgi:hypothetical protein
VPVGEGVTVGEVEGGESGEGREGGHSGHNRRKRALRRQTRQLRASVAPGVEAAAQAELQQRR